jgi:hypothetical protein
MIMPNLYNTDLAQNARRAATGGSNYGTRRIQFYQITIFGITDAEVAKLNDYRIVNNTELDIDQEAEREFRSATWVEAIVRGVQQNAELYMVGAHDVDGTETPGYSDLKITIGVAGDTFSSGWEMDNRDDPATRDNDNAYLGEAIEDISTGYREQANTTNEGFRVRPVFIYGHEFALTDNDNDDC